MFISEQYIFLLIIHVKMFRGNRVYLWNNDAYPRDYAGDDVTVSDAAAASGDVVVVVFGRLRDETGRLRLK